MAPGWWMRASWHVAVITVVCAGGSVRWCVVITQSVVLFACWHGYALAAAVGQDGILRCRTAQA
ncbi:hypothetical protein O982_23965 [Mycobacterium avium 10-5581]|nr:hypothetical protein O982_23965 [Mycobacterium avium 10-5581]